MAKTTTPIPSPREAQRRQVEQMDAREVQQPLRDPDFNSWELVGQRRELAPCQISAAVSLLARKGLVERQRRGRPSANGRADSLRVNAVYGHVIGVDIGGSNLRIALADVHGTVLGKWSTSTRETSSPDMVVEQIREGTRYLLEHTSVSRRSLLAVAAGAPGVTDGDAGVVVATSYLKGWSDVPLRSMLESALRIPAAVENDVRLAAIGENWTGAARGIRNFVFLAIGTGIAAGIFANGKLLHGTNWTAGEIGYMHVPGTPEGAAQQGSPGSLEGVIGGEGIRQQWLHGCNGTGTPRTGDLTATEIFERASAGDVLAESVLKRSAQVLAYAVYNISLVLNCELFVLGGGVGMSGPLRDATRRVLEQYSAPARPQLITSSLGEDAQQVGAIRLALDRAQSRIGLKL